MNKMLEKTMQKKSLGNCRVIRRTLHPNFPRKTKTTTTERNNIRVSKVELKHNFFIIMSETEAFGQREKPDLTPDPQKQEFVPRNLPNTKAKNT